MKKIIKIALSIASINLMGDIYASSSCSTWKMSGKCYQSTPTQAISKINGSAYNESPGFNNCIASCNGAISNQWSIKMPSNVPYMQCANQCIVGAGFIEVDSCGAQKLLQQTNCYGR